MKSMKTSKDSFRIDIVLRHATHTPESISAALSLKPEASWPAGESLGKFRAKWSFFYGRLLEGSVPSDYERALKTVSRFLRKNAFFLADFAGRNGEAELILNHAVSQQDEKGDELFELFLTPAFLRDLSAGNIGLRVQGWQSWSKKAGQRKRPVA